ncbi:MAG: dienelactone hydrolase family protein [Vicinamibacterales bacterium]
MSDARVDGGRAVRIEADDAAIVGDLVVSSEARGLVLFAHGSGSSRFSHRNCMVARALESAGFATLLLDLLTPGEEAADRGTGQFRFDIPRLGRRVTAAVDWTADEPALAGLTIACFGASTGAAAALIAAAERPARVRAVISRGGRPDLAAAVLPLVQAPTLLIVGGADEEVLMLNRAAMDRMATLVELAVVPGATHLFEEPGALEQVCALAADWCRRYLRPSA